MPLPIFDLNEIQIATPCHVKWEDMKGGDRTRHCDGCQKNVFNLSGMGRLEALDLVRTTDGPMCVRFYQRADGTVLTADCPVGMKLAARRAKRFVLSATAASLGAMASVLAFIASASPKSAPLEKAQAAVVEVKRTVDVANDQLVVPETPHSHSAGGIRMSPQEEEPEPLKSDGRLTPAHVLVVVKKQSDDVRACGTKFGATGVINMSWTIEPNGHTSHVKVKDEKLAHTPVGKCLVHLVKTWRFAESSAATPVNFPLKLGK